MTAISAVVRKVFMRQYRKEIEKQMHEGETSPMRATATLYSFVSTAVPGGIFLSFWQHAHHRERSEAWWE